MIRNPVTDDIGWRDSFVGDGDDSLGNKILQCGIRQSDGTKGWVVGQLFGRDLIVVVGHAKNAALGRNRCYMASKAGY